MTLPTIAAVDMAMSIIEASKQDPAGEQQLADTAAIVSEFSTIQRDHIKAEFNGDAFLAGFVLAVYACRAAQSQ
jgi:hypothetical protein